MHRGTDALRHCLRLGRADADRGLDLDLIDAGTDEIDEELEAVLQLVEGEYVNFAQGVPEQLERRSLVRVLGSDPGDD